MPGNKWQVSLGNSGHFPPGDRSCLLYQKPTVHPSVTIPIILRGYRCSSWCTERVVTGSRPHSSHNAEQRCGQSFRLAPLLPGLPAVLLSTKMEGLRKLEVKSRLLPGPTGPFLMPSKLLSFLAGCWHPFSSSSGLPKGPPAGSSHQEPQSGYNGPQPLPPSKAWLREQASLPAVRAPGH